MSESPSQLSHETTKFGLGIVVIEILWVGASQRKSPPGQVWCPLALCLYRFNILNLSHDQRVMQLYG